MTNRPGFWEKMIVLGPALALVGIPVIVRLLGGFENFQMVDKPVTALEAFGILGTMFCPVMAWFYAQMRLEQCQARLAQSWPVAPGKIRTWKMIERRDFRGKLRYRVTVAYDYSVGGLTRRGDTLAFGPPYTTDARVADELTSKYAEDATVEVHYDPAAPSIAVLDCSEDYARERRAILWYFGLMLVALPLLVLFTND